GSTSRCRPYRSGRGRAPSAGGRGRGRTLLWARVRVRRARSCGPPHVRLSQVTAAGVPTTAGRISRWRSGPRSGAAGESVIVVATAPVLLLQRGEHGVLAVVLVVLGVLEQAGLLDRVGLERTPRGTAGHAELVHLGRHLGAGVGERYGVAVLVH